MSRVHRHCRLEPYLLRKTSGGKRSSLNNCIQSEEDLIRRFLAPLAAENPGALGLLDDCALLKAPIGQELVLTTDAVAAGVHFFPDDAPEDIAWKALAVNVSDLAGKGANPIAYQMALSFPQSPEEDWLTKFADGLRSAQQRFGLTLAGGDTDRRPGPITITITAIGSVAAGTMVRRTTARAGDRILISGTLGDAAFGLQLRRDSSLAKSWELSTGEQEYLLGRYLRPEPRLALREALICHASAAMDISDGLAKDLGRMCRASSCGAQVNSSLLPLSLAANKVLSGSAGRMTAIVAGGDDYEILAAVSPDRVERFRQLAAVRGVSITDVGVFAGTVGVDIVGAGGLPLDLDSTGWDHFGGR